MKNTKSKKDIEAGKLKRLKNLIPAKPGNNGYGGGRPKGSISLENRFKNALKIKDPSTGKTLFDLMIENAVKRAVNKGGREIKLILDLLEEKQTPLPGADTTKTLEGFTEKEIEQLAKLKLAQRTRLGSKRSKDR